MAPALPPSEVVRSRKNAGVTRLRSLAQAAGRAEHELFLVEGVRGVESALALRAPLTEAWVSPRLTREPRGRDLEAALRGAGVPVIEATDDVLQAASTTQSHQGILATCRPWQVPATPSEFPPGDVLVLADMQDPGNVGTLWRSAAATGCGLLVQGDAGVDPYSPKVVRAAAGAAFRIPVQRRPMDEPFLAALADAGYQLVGAAGGAPDRYDQIAWGPRVALLVGQEGPGLPPAWLARCHRTVHIPMAAGVESLNAAVSATLILYERARSAAFATLGSMVAGGHGTEGELG